MNRSMRRLSDLLNGQNRDELAKLFDEAPVAAEYAPVPAGTYLVDFVHGELCQSKSGTMGYTCQFEIADGEHRGRRIWHTLWLSESAVAYTKRDLLKLGINKLSQCEQPVPPGIYCTLKVVVRLDDDGNARNHVTKIEAGGVRPEPFADPDFGGFGPTSAEKGGAA